MPAQESPYRRLGFRSSPRLAIFSRPNHPWVPIHQNTENTMAYELPPLPYPSNALEPNIDAKTMEIHHGKHHAAYVNNLNNAVKGHPDLESLSAADLIKDLT